MNEKKKIIAFGVAGEGRGHAARAIALSEILQDYFDIFIFAPSSISDFLSSKLYNIEIIEIPGINFHKENHVIKYHKTLMKNLTNIGRVHPEVKKITELMRNIGVDAVVSDFEPYTAIAASFLNLPVLNLNHPGVVLRYFSLKPDALAARLAARIMMPSGTQELICSFYGGDIGPIIRKEIKSKEPFRGNYYVIYTKEESRTAVLKALECFPDVNFRVFPNQQEDFTEALIGCKGVISSSGHQMLSEALYLRKPILAFPQKMQFEQRLNAIMLERSGRGLHGDINHIERSLQEFIEAIDSFPMSPATHDHFLFTDFTQAAANCIRNFVIQNDPAYTTKQIGGFKYRKNRPVQVKPA
ncbi:MAG: glycosyltransferase family protein [Spirochaetales bacterium]|uniref:Glycosyltransferase family protein n=1 Tax=Candidatus Thalassospirochaeta sargassi TaxID=3119039 RepID=A0AAJ1IFY4_9SPIO|nr:glycosyltransferase family protein [Spirochaetales bacterium]